PYPSPFQLPETPFSQNIDPELKRWMVSLLRKEGRKTKKEDKNEGSAHVFTVIPAESRLIPSPT
ncbi:MAG: hypothetical protein EBU36_06120, partial [Verrucomicrobia bacterium]|nr:hypothetical protein [Verrucomicrobiota bacterium]